jgi:putative ATP-dependent endonuclease of OLD family
MRPNIDQREGEKWTAQAILKTNKYRTFEDAIAEAFLSQIRHTTHEVKLDFRTFDPLNFYKSLQPLLLENGVRKSPSEAGAGMRNLIVMALFRSYAKAFRGDAIFAIEEPEIYLHPHAQRSLAALFDELAAAGNQVFYSTHSATFVNGRVKLSRPSVRLRTDRGGDPV